MRYLNIRNVKIYCNMDNIFLVAGIISVIYFIGKFLEMRYVDQEPKPLKLLVRDSLLVYVSVVVGNFIVDQLKPVIEEVDIKTVSPPVFTDNPSF
jgi:hypothetical protein